MLCNIMDYRKSQIVSTSIVNSLNYDIKPLRKLLPKELVSSKVYFLEYSTDTGIDPVYSLIWSDTFYIKYQVSKNRIKFLEKGEKLSGVDRKMASDKLNLFESMQEYPNEMKKLPIQENVLSVISCSVNEKLPFNVETRLFYD